MVLTATFSLQASGTGRLHIPIVVLCGIGSPQIFCDKCSSLFPNVVAELIYPDLRFQTGSETLIFLEADLP